MQVTPEEVRSAERMIEAAWKDREALDRIARVVDRFLAGSHAEMVVNEIAIEVQIVRPRCGEFSCIRTKGHEGAHWGRPSCGHRGCMDSDGHIDECLEDRQESLIP